MSEIYSLKESEKNIILWVNEYIKTCENLGIGQDDYETEIVTMLNREFYLDLSR